MYRESAYNSEGPLGWDRWTLVLCSTDLGDGDLGTRTPDAYVGKAEVKLADEHVHLGDVGGDTLDRRTVRLRRLCMLECSREPERSGVGKGTGAEVLTAAQ